MYKYGRDSINNNITLHTFSKFGYLFTRGLLQVLQLPFLKHFERFLGGLDAAYRHRSERGSHAICTVDFAEFHTADNETRNNLTGPLDDSILGSVHVQAPHTAKLLDLLHADESLDGEGTERSVVASSADHQRGVDGVRVHAALVVVVHGDESPVGDDTGDAELTIRPRRASDEVLNSRGVEKLDIGEGQDFAEQSRGKESGVLDDNVVSFFLVWDAKVAEEGVGGLAHDHGREKLATEPGTTTFG